MNRPDKITYQKAASGVYSVWHHVHNGRYYVISEVGYVKKTQHHNLWFGATYDTDKMTDFYRTRGGAGIEVVELAKEVA